MTNPLPTIATGWTAKLKALSESAANAAASLQAYRNHTQMSDDEAAFWLACRLADDRAGHKLEEISPTRKNGVRSN